MENNEIPVQVYGMGPGWTSLTHTIPMCHPTHTTSLLTKSKTQNVLFLSFFHSFTPISTVISLISKLNLMDYHSSQFYSNVPLTFVVVSKLMLIHPAAGWVQDSLRGACCQVLWSAEGDQKGRKGC